MSLRDLQKEIKAWSERNFPDVPRDGLHAGLGAVEEWGEFKYADDPDEKLDAIGDMTIYLLDMAWRAGFEVPSDSLIGQKMPGRRTDLTKRPERRRSYRNERGFIAPHIWEGISCNDQRTAEEAVAVLMKTTAGIRWASYEPATARVDWEQIEGADSLDWIVVGGESGPRARPFSIEWAEDTIEFCKANGIACFVKQLGSDRASRLEYKDRKGGDPDEWLSWLRVREYPRQLTQEERERAYDGR